jgi:transposase
MLPLAGQHRILLYRQPTDMRKSFDGLCVVVSALMSLNPLSGDIYVFLNRRRDRMKLLLWNRGGFWISGFSTNGLRAALSNCRPILTSATLSSCPMKT